MAIKRPWVLSQSTSVTETRIGVPKCWANHPGVCARNVLSDEKIETLIVRSTSTRIGIGSFSVFIIVIIVFQSLF